MYVRCLRLMLKFRVTKLRALVLTFDDGPGSRLTPIILDILDKHNSKATFFLTGANIVGRESIVQQISSRRHEICSHGLNHIHHWKVSPLRAIRDINQGWRSIDKALGANRRKYPYRPPYARLSLVFLLYLFVLRVPIIYWTIDAGDTWSPVQRDNQRLALLTKQNGGAVVLAHDFDPSDFSTDNTVIESIRSVLANVQRHGLRTLIVKQLLIDGK